MVMKQAVVNVSIVTYRTDPKELERCLSCLTSNTEHIKPAVAKTRQSATFSVPVKIQFVLTDSNTYRTDPKELERCLSCLTSMCVRRVYVIDNGKDGVIADICARYGSDHHKTSLMIRHIKSHIMVQMLQKITVIMYAEKYDLDSCCQYGEIFQQMGMVA